MAIEPVTHLERYIAGTVEPVTHLEKVIEQYGGGGGGGGGGSVTSVNGKTGAVRLTAADLDDSFKDALLDCFAKVAWNTEDGQQYYDALEAALYPPTDLLSISAVFEQGETVIYDTDSLDALKPMLTVTANYDNGTSRTVTNYTLSGTLTVGTSTITVSYRDKTTAFDVTVSGNQALYPMESGTKTLSTSKETVTVSNGNHVKIDFTADHGASTGYVLNLSNLALNGSDSAYSRNTAAINNLSNVLFHINANQSAVLKIENITKSRTELLMNTDSASQFLLLLKKTNSTSNVDGLRVGYTSGTTEQMEATQTVDAAADISCLTLYFAQVRGVSVEFDISLTVDGVRYI